MMLLSLLGLNIPCLRLLLANEAWWGLWTISNVEEGGIWEIYWLVDAGLHGVASLKLHLTPPSHVSTVVVNAMASFNKHVQVIIERGNSLLPYVAVWVATSLPPLLRHSVLAHDLVLKLSKLSMSNASIIHRPSCIRNWRCSVVNVRILWFHCSILGHILNQLWRYIGYIG